MATQLIINADDFGFSTAVNAAVARARAGGMLTSASLMVRGSAVREAVSIAKDNPGLAVGLHLVLTRERSALGCESIPDLVDQNSHFRPDPILASVKYYFSRRARRQLKNEIEAQFAAFADFGLPLSHVDGHQHLHAHPAVLPIVVELAQRYDAGGIRVPRDPFWRDVRADPSRIGYKLAVAAGNAYLARTCRRYLHRSGLARCDVVVGSLMSGSMTDDSVVRVLRGL